MVLFFLNFRKIKCIFYAFLAPLMHVQSLPLLLMSSLRNKRFMIFTILIVATFLYTNYSLFLNFIYEPFLRYSERYEGSQRLIIYFIIPIHILVLCFINRSRFKDLKYIFLLSLIINVVFINNSHIASRLTRCVDVLILPVSFIILKDLFFKSFTTTSLFFIFNCANVLIVSLFLLFFYIL